MIGGRAMIKAVGDLTADEAAAELARLAQVFWNLMLNAVKFTPAQGHILIQTSNPAAGSVRIEVSDNGIGIEPEMLARIFEPFQQGEASTTRRYGGLGLGQAAFFQDGGDLAAQRAALEV